MWKSWLPSFRLATELALSIGSKKASHSHAKAISRFKVWGWWNWTCFLIHVYLTCVYTGLLLWLRYQNISKRVYMLFEVFEDYARILRWSQILDASNFWIHKGMLPRFLSDIHIHVAQSFIFLLCFVDHCLSLCPFSFGIDYHQCEEHLVAPSDDRQFDSNSPLWHYCNHGWILPNN